MTAAAYHVGEPLSAREMEVLALVADGLGNPEIGERLCLSSMTVKSHLRNMGQKLGCGERAGMVAIAFRTGLLEVPRPSRPPLPEALREEMLVLARMVVENRPLGAVRESARRVVAWSKVAA